MRALLTGATGFLGRHLLACLQHAGVEVAAVVRSRDAAVELGRLGVAATIGSIEDSAALRHALSVPTDCVFHVAADTRQWHRHADEQSHTNIEGTRNVIEAAQAAGVRRFVHTSSVAVYGHQQEVITEA